MHRHGAGTKSGSHPLRAWGEVQGTLGLELSLVLKRLTRRRVAVEIKREGKAEERETIWRVWGLDREWV